MKFMDLITGAANAVSSSGQAADKLQTDVEEAKTAAVTYAGVSLLLQAVAASAGVVLAYVAWQNLHKGRRTLFNNSNGKGRRK